jgi:hypothetical protein
MTFEASPAAFAADAETFVSYVPALVRPSLPANDPADPEAGWASRNPARAFAFLYVSPRPCAALDELMAL